MFEDTLTIVLWRNYLKTMSSKNTILNHLLILIEHDQLKCISIYCCKKVCSYGKLFFLFHFWQRKISNNSKFIKILKQILNFQMNGKNKVLKYLLILVKHDQLKCFSIYYCNRTVYQENYFLFSFFWQRKHSNN